MEELELLKKCRSYSKVAIYINKKYNKNYATEYVKETLKTLRSIHKGEVPRWIIKNLDECGNCYMRPNHVEGYYLSSTKYPDKIIENLTKLGYTIRKKITLMGEIILEKE